MTRILVLCEGQTEETFVKRILAPHLAAYGKSIIPILLVTKKVKTRAVFTGGVTSYAKLRRDVLRLLGDSGAACVTTMLDYYGLPDDFPGKNTLQGHTPYERVAYLENTFGQDINRRHFHPYLMLHEFEAFLFSQPATILTTIGMAGTPVLFGEDISTFRSPEEINDGPQTHPSARIRRVFRAYRKISHGLRIAEQIGLSHIRSRCPHFDSWLNFLEKI